MSDDELLTLAQKVEQENKQLKGKLAAEQAKNKEAVGKLEAKMKKMKDGGSKAHTDATKEAKERFSDRTETSDQLKKDEAEVAKVMQLVLDTKEALAKARSDFDKLWASVQGCKCKSQGKAALLSEARSLGLVEDPGTEHSKKIMRVEDAERKRLGLKEQIEDEVLKFSNTQRIMLDRMDDLGVALRLKATKHSASERADEAQAKIQEHQVSAVKRYKENQTKQLVRLQASKGEVLGKIKEMQAALKRCGCLA